MRWMLWTTTLLLIVNAGCVEPPPASYEPVEPIDLVQPGTPPVLPPTAQTPQPADRLTGIAQVRLNPGSSVTLVDAENMERAINLKMFNESGNVVNAVNLQIGQSVRMSDERYVTIWYTLANVAGNQLTFRVTGRFDARAFNDDVNIHQKTVVVIPYP